MTTKRSALQLDMTDALVTAMEQADVALDDGDIERHDIWHDWAQTLSEHLRGLAARQ